MTSPTSGLVQESFASTEKEAASLRARVKDLEAKSQNLEATASSSSDELKTLAMAYQNGLAKLGVANLQDTTAPEEITKVIAARVESMLAEQVRAMSVEQFCDSIHWNASRRFRGWYDQVILTSAVHQLRCTRARITLVPVYTRSHGTKQQYQHLLASIAC